MKIAHWLGILTTASALGVFGGCGEPRSEPTLKKTTEKASTEPEHHHDDEGPGPHGGTIFHFSKYHTEFTADHKAKEVTIYVLTLSGNKPAPITIDKPLLSIKNPPFQVELKAVPLDGEPEGKSSRYVAKHDNFGKEQEFEGTMSGVVDKKPYAGDFKEEEHKDHKHEKK